MRVGNVIGSGKVYDYITGGQERATFSRAGVGGMKWFGGRGFSIEGYSPPGSPTTTNTLQYLSIGSGGTSVDFGDGTSGTDGASQCDGEASDGIRMVIQPGYSVGAGGTPPEMQYFNGLVHSNAVDFGEMVATTWPKGAASNGNRVMSSAGDYTNRDTEFFNINTKADAVASNDQAQDGAGRAAITDGHRGVFGGGRNGPGGFHDAMEYFQIQNAYSGTDFSELATANYFFTTMSALGGRGLYLTGGQHPNTQIKAFNISTLASAFDFGEMEHVQAGGAGSSDGIRGHSSGAHGLAGDWGTPTAASVQYVNIYTRGNAVDYGEQVPGIYAQQSRGGSSA